MIELDDPITLEDAYTVPTYTRVGIALERGEGSAVWDTEGNRYLDLYGGHCVALLGHCPPRVVDALERQARKLLFYSNVVYSPVRAGAAQRLAALAPAGLGHAFFCNSGTEANETALKMARAFTGRFGVVAMEGGFHGRTLGSLAVTAGQGYRAPYLDVLPATRFVPFGDIEAVARALQPGDVAAVILEPIQSMAGVFEAPAGYYLELRELCDAHGTLLIFDEVQTGVGRTGAFSYGEHVDVVPDLITLAKSLGAGVPVGAVLAHERIANTVRPGDQGTTFGGGMLAMAAVSATLEHLAEERLMERAAEVFDRVQAGLSAVPGVADVRGRGCLIGVEIDRPAGAVLAALRRSGVLAGGSDHPRTIRLMPPLVITDAEISEAIAAFSTSLMETA
jgi:acetylornithine/succinyldiaminopimelate/putrescine aminotransferase